MADVNSSVLLLHEGSEALRALERELRAQGVRVFQARTCAEAILALARPQPPEVVFTATELPDGKWLDVVRLAERAPRYVNVIVVSRLVDIHLYVEAIESGAFDFIAPPFEASELTHVVRCAVGNAMAQRNSQVEVAPLNSRELRRSSLPVAS